MKLREVKRQDKDTCEIHDDLSAIVEVNRNKIESENLILRSLNVTALCPSLDIQFTAEKVAMEFVESNFEFEKESIDVYELGLYLVLTMDDCARNAPKYICSVGGDFPRINIAIALLFILFCL